MLSMKIFSEWSFMRWFRLVMGGVMLYQAYVTEDALSGFIGAFLLLQAITNTGCMSGSCSVPKSNVKSDDIADPTFVAIGPR